MSLQVAWIVHIVLHFVVYHCDPQHTCVLWFYIIRKQYILHPSLKTLRSPLEFEMNSVCVWTSSSTQQEPVKIDLPQTLGRDFLDSPCQCSQEPLDILYSHLIYWYVTACDKHQFFAFLALRLLITGNQQRFDIFFSFSIYRTTVKPILAFHLQGKDYMLLGWINPSQTTPGKHKNIQSWHSWQKQHTFTTFWEAETLDVKYSHIRRNRFKSHIETMQA